MRQSAVILSAVCLGTALPAAAILIRADRDDAEYVELASRYESALRLEPVDAEGVLIAPRWVLTYAGNAQELEEKKPWPRLRIGKSEHEIQAIFRSPKFLLGLVLLKSAVTGMEPTPLYRADDEAGKAVVLVSHGPSGKVGDEKVTRDKRARAGINTVDAIAAHFLILRIKPPEEASDLQGVAIQEDRGAPAYIETPEGIFVAGIAWVSSTEGKPATSGNHFIRVSPLVPWIEAVMLDVAKKEMDSLLDPDRR